MRTLLNPKPDIVFKKIFTADEEILRDLINLVLTQHHWKTATIPLLSWYGPI